MKKRIISGISLLLSLTLLLSSCAIFEKKTKMIDKGTALYSLVVDKKASAAVEEKVLELVLAVAEKTGVNLLEAEVAEGAPRILVGNTGEAPSLAAAERLDATNFYVGFSGTDLVIQALNDAMLISALDYLLNNFVSGANANIKDGKFSLPQTLDYIPPSLTCSGEEFSITVGADTSERALAAVAGLRSAILNATGVDIRIKADLGKDEPETKEIIIGSVEKSVSAAPLAALAFNEYYIGIEGNKIMILATNDIMLEYAVDAFVKTFITAKDAVASKEQKTFSLPLSFSQLGSKTAFLLTENGQSNAVLIYPAAAGDVAISAINEFCESYKLLTGCTLPAYKDSERTKPQDNEFEFLIGNTNRNASALALSAVPAGKWSAHVSRNCLTLAAHSDNGIRIAIRALARAIIPQVQATTKKSVCDAAGEIAGGVNRLFFLHSDFTLSATASPDITATASGWEEVSEGAYILFQQNGTKAMYNAYLSRLSGAGYKVHEASAKAGNVWSATYYSDSELLNITFAEGIEDNTIRVVVDPLEETTIPSLTGTSLTGKTNVQPLFIQMGGGGIYSQSPNGMCYALRLYDGTFILIDGNSSEPSVCEEIINTLKEYNVLEGKPIISCWIITHGHGDHIGAFNQISASFTDEIDVRGVMYNFPSSAQTRACATAYENPDDNTVSIGTLNVQERFRQNAKRFGEDVKIYKARTGMNYAFAGCNIEMLFTLEDFPKPSAKLTFYNSTSLVFRITFSNASGSVSHTFMILGDASPESNTVLTERYGSYLQSNAVQVAHHGYIGAIDAVYDAIAAAVVFWPQGEDYANGHKFTVTDTMLKKSYSKVCYVGYHGTVALTLTQVREGVTKGKVYHTGRTAADAVSRK